MRILVIGSGGREHALVWKLAQSPYIDKIFCAPGNGGISDIAECVDIKGDDVPALVDFAGKEKIDLTVVGPEVPLAAGIADECVARKLAVFGPNKKAAFLEASKVFAKELMARHKIPTAAFKVFDDSRAAREYLSQLKGPCVVKADGLAQGKGVVVAQDAAEAQEAVESMMEKKAFGPAGDKIIIEECLQGQEASILVITDSRDIIALATSQDHKRVFDDDKGPNTGGMGAYSPTPVVTAPLMVEIMEKIIVPVIDGMVREGIDYRGVLYAGVMITKDGPSVLEFNVRFGDPETQAILPRLRSDLFEVMMAASGGSLSKIIKAGGLVWDSSPCVCVVCSAKGYPGPYEKGKEITGLNELKGFKDIEVFHAGTKKISAGAHDKARYVTDGGRVLGVTGMGNTIVEAIDSTYTALRGIRFEGMHYRTDIGRRARLYY